MPVTGNGAITQPSTAELAVAAVRACGVPGRALLDLRGEATATALRRVLEHDEQVHITLQQPEHEVWLDAPNSSIPCPAVSDSTVEPFSTSSNTSSGRASKPAADLSMGPPGISLVRDRRCPHDTGYRNRC